MGVYYISVEKNVDRFEFYRVLWQVHGIDGIRADTMSEGISKAIEMEQSKNDKLFFLVMVADDVDFLPQLRILSDATTVPILVVTSKDRYTVDEHHAALSEGADFYGVYNDTPDVDLDGVFAIVSSVNKRINKRAAPSGIIAHSDMLIVTDHHKAFIKDTEIYLTAAEIRILHYMLANRGNVLSHKQLYSRINDNNFGEWEMTPDAVYNAIKRLRKKIKDVAQTEYIETVKDVGYRLKTKSELND